MKKSFKYLGMIAFMFSFLICGFLLAFVFGVARVPKPSLLFFLLISFLFAGSWAWLFTYLKILNPHWANSKKELDDEKNKLMLEYEEVHKLSNKYKARFEQEDNKYKKAARTAIEFLEKMDDPNGILKDKASALRAETGILD